MAMTEEEQRRKNEGGLTDTELHEMQLKVLEHYYGGDPDIPPEVAAKIRRLKKTVAREAFLKDLELSNSAEKEEGRVPNKSS
jgi:hypothetical protein